MNRTPTVIREMQHEARTACGWASVAGAVARGELRPTSAERIDRLMTRARAHRAAGRERAGRAAVRMVERLLDELDGRE